jgi:hypothetical protein
MPSTLRFRRYWDVADYVKRKLFNKLRDASQRINYLDYREYRRAFEDIYDSLLDEWRRIQQEFEGDPDFDSRRLKGYLLEALFCYACQKLQASFMDVELAEMGGAKFEKSPPWFEATPLYDIIPPLHHVREKGVRRRKVPQTRADYLVTYVDDSGPVAPSMVDVKTRKPQKWRNEWGWQITAALRRGFTFQIAYPKKGVEYPRELAEWVTATPCLDCKKLSRNPRRCSECGAIIYPFTIADAYYEAKELRWKLGKDRKGRF